MHGEKQIASITAQGRAEIFDDSLMPYDLYMEQGEDVDTLVNNLSNFYHWCATRLLLLERAYAKEILNSMGATQSATDRDRALVALSYHCLTLTDIWWVRSSVETTTFAEINLYEKYTDNIFADIAIKGSQASLPDAHLIARDASTQGLCPKAWIKKEDGFYLLKDGEEEGVENELLAGKICTCFDIRAVRYEEDMFEGLQVSVSRLMTNRDQGIVSREAFEIYAANHDIKAEEYILSLDAHGFYMMNIMDYLVGNTDRHWGNWGFLMDNRTNTPLRLHDLMDFNRSFRAYDTIDGANCQTIRSRSLSQKEAALEAVRANGLNQISEIDRDWFAGRDAVYEMFCRRLSVLSSEQQ